MESIKTSLYIFTQEPFRGCLHYFNILKLTEETIKSYLGYRVILLHERIIEIYFDSPVFIVWHFLFTERYKRYWLLL